ncbi:MAG: hypothetical protein UGF45_00450 [Massilioclostridium sp.]|nr:hypothetical protein [Massilioclostridium sp.]
MIEQSIRPGSFILCSVKPDGGESDKAVIGKMTESKQGAFELNWLNLPLSGLMGKPV